jgi:hypothetical protein
MTALYYDAVSSYAGRMFEELGRIWKIPEFDWRDLGLPQKKPLSRWPVSQPVFEPSNYRILVYGVTVTSALPIFWVMDLCFLAF